MSNDKTRDKQVESLKRQGWRFESPNTFDLTLMDRTFTAVPKHSLMVPDGAYTNACELPDDRCGARVGWDGTYGATIEIVAHVTGDERMPESVRAQITTMLQEIHDAIEHSLALGGEMQGTLVAESVGYFLTTMATAARMKASSDKAEREMMAEDAEEHGIDGRLERERAGDEAPEA